MDEEAIKKKIEDYVDSYCDYVISTTARINEDVRKVLESDIDDLPLLINMGTPAAQKLLAVRLADEKVQDHQPFTEVMSNHVFNMEDYRNIGVNDGALMAMADMADLFGMEDVARRARFAVYSYE